MIEGSLELGLKQGWAGSEGERANSLGFCVYHENVKWFCLPGISLGDVGMGLLPP